VIHRTDRLQLQLQLSTMRSWACSTQKNQNPGLAWP